jgi:hypothetical protein
LIADYEQGTFDCPAGQIEVRTYDFFSCPPVLADNIAFNFVVP